MKKNTTGQKIGCQMISATDGSSFTGTVTCYPCGDAGTQAIGTVGSGVCTHEGNGFHTYAPSQAETNFDHLAFTFIGTGAIPATVQTYTTYPQTGDTYTLADGATGFAAIDTVVDTISGKIIGTLATGTHVAQTGDSYALANGATGFDAIDSVVDTISGKIIGTLATGTHVAQTGDSYALANGATGFDALAGGLALTLGNTATALEALEAIDTEVLDLMADMDKVPKSDGVVTFNATAVTGIQNGLATAYNLGVIDSLVDGIKTKTDNLPTDPADQSAVESAITNATSPLATSSALTIVAEYIDTEIGSLVSDMAKVPKSDGDVTFNATAVTGIQNGLATTTDLSAVDTVVDGIAIDTAALITSVGNVKTDTEAIISDVSDVKVDTAAILEDTGSTGVVVVDQIGYSKGLALSNFTVPMVLSTDHITPATGKTVTCRVRKDAGSFSNSTSAVTEVSLGVYTVDLTNTEMNADIVTLVFTATDCDQRTIQLKTSA